MAKHIYHVLCPIVLPSYHCIVSFLLDFYCKQGFNYCTVHSSHIFASFWLPLFISYLWSLKTESLDDANTVLIGLTIIITQLYHDFQIWSFRHQFKTWKCFFFYGGRNGGYRKLCWYSNYNVRKCNFIARHKERHKV